jgi:predicted transcriptional regulator
MGLTTDYQLGELETAVMEIVWQHEEVTVREVWEALQPARPLAYTTVMTVMGRMVPKGVLAVEKRGKTAYYRPTGTREQVLARQAQRAVHDVLSNFGDAAIAGFLREMQTIDPQRIEALRGLLDQDQKRHDLE